MIKAIFVTEYGKHYFECIIAEKFGYKLNVMNPRKSEFLIFDDNDSVSYIHDHICGWYRPLANGEIPIYRIVENFRKPSEFIPFTKEETEYWLYSYYINWESTAQSQKEMRRVKSLMAQSFPPVTPEYKPIFKVWS